MHICYLWLRDNMGRSSTSTLQSGKSNDPDYAITWVILFATSTVVKIIVNVLAFSLYRLFSFSLPMCCFKLRAVKIGTIQIWYTVIVLIDSVSSHLSISSDSRRSLAISRMLRISSQRGELFNEYGCGVCVWPNAFVCWIEKDHVRN